MDGMSLSPFHDGEREVQVRAGVREEVEPRGSRFIRDFMPDQHRTFFPLLSFLPVAIEAADGSPAATILTGPPGFVSSPDPRRLQIAALPDPADPAARWLTAGAAVGILGVDLGTRRRNRANGRIAGVGAAGFAVAVAQSFGNCARYIQLRELTPAPRAPTAYERLGAIDAAARAAIAGADTFFVASGTEAGMDISHRGGRPGFVRVDGDVLTVPDFAGNHYFNTLGNLAVSGRAALLFPDFETGDLLHLAGAVELVWEGEEVHRFQGAERLWRVHVASGWRRCGALPLRGSLREYARATLGTGTWPA